MRCVSERAQACPHLETKNVREYECTNESRETVRVYGRTNVRGLSFRRVVAVQIRNPQSEIRNRGASQPLSV
jgi:hypothetical protein